MAEISNFNLLFVNIYAPNVKAEIKLFFAKLENIVKEESDDFFIVVGGDWNCTLDFILDRNGEEPHAQSASCLAGVLKRLSLSDVWREHNLSTKQYTWVKVNNERISAARLDRFYMSCNLKNRVIPNILSDHKHITVGFTLSKSIHKSYYWHLNTKLLEDTTFCEDFECCWEAWQTEQSHFENIIQWKLEKCTRDFSQNYTAYSSV